MLLCDPGWVGSDITRAVDGSTRRHPSTPTHCAVTDWPQTYTHKDTQILAYVQVGGDALLKALEAAFSNAPDVAAIRPVLDAYVTAIRWVQAG